LIPVFAGTTLCKSNAFVFDATRNFMEIGRSQFVDKSELMSRKHLRVYWSPPGGLRFEDVDSINGTVVNGTPVKQGTLGHQNVLMLGDVLFVTSIERDDLVCPAVVDDSIVVAAASRAVLRDVHSIAKREKSVLILGETGTGKERTAAAIHRLSLRGDGPYVVVNCGSLKPELFESELFGHVRGAFTGAVDTKTGALEAAHGGTIFLDEIGDLPPPAQVALLRVLETGQFSRLGELSVTKQINLRLISATNRLVSESANGTFRKDLLYRISAFRIQLAPLNQRREEILLLVDHYWEREKPARELNLTALAAQELLLYEWPGNVRELVNVVGRLVAKSEGSHEPISDGLVRECIQDTVLAFGVCDSEERQLPTTPLYDFESFTREDWIQLLKRFRGNLTKIAQHLNTNHKKVRAHLAKHGLEPSQYK
jgi:transcriptional regulator with GAF, ATPase, and Fis domain